MSVREGNIVYFYAAYSSYAWLGSARLLEISKAAGRSIVHKPMDLKRVMAAAGSTSFAERSLDFRNYFFNRELERWAEFRGLRTLGRRPTFHHHGYDLANRVLVAAILAGNNIDQLAHAFLDGHWAADADLADAETLVELAGSVGLDGTNLLAASSSTRVAEQYEVNTLEAIDMKVFGSPTYVVDGDIFYGQDRLEMVERAMIRPFSDMWPKPGPQGELS
jgi:2-hydroxychromene-2-carboxylate isomerase